jgi:hypothetical protein
MSRYRDSKGIFISSKISEKLEKQTTRKPPHHTNSTKIGSETILRGESSKETIETISKGTKYEAIVQTKNIIQQEIREVLTTPSE